MCSVRRDAAVSSGPPEREICEIPGTNAHFRGSKTDR
jgi:hypothetical protein